MYSPISWILFCDLVSMETGCSKAMSSSHVNTDLNHIAEPFHKSALNCDLGTISIMHIHIEPFIS